MYIPLQIIATLFPKKIKFFIHAAGAHGLFTNFALLFEHNQTVFLA